MSNRVADVAAIKAIIASQETAFNTKDADLFIRSWRERSWAVSVSGAELAGPAEMREAARAGFAGPLADEYATYEPGHVEFLADDVAILHVYARATTPAGEPIDDDVAMIALYVLARDEDTWEIVARQNTLVSR